FGALRDGWGQYRSGVAGGDGPAAQSVCFLRSQIGEIRNTGADREKWRTGGPPHGVRSEESQHLVRHRCEYHRPSSGRSRRGGEADALDSPRFAIEKFALQFLGSPVGAGRRLGIFLSTQKLNRLSD